VEQYGDSGVEIENEFAFNAEGSGGGMTAEFGGQISFQVSGRFFLFAEGLYSYQIISLLKGRDFQRMFGFTENWEGVLGIKETTWSEPWGNHTEITPSNFWIYEEGERKRDMRLDLSGFQINIEIQIRI
jgi:hypothetical protein